MPLSDPADRHPHERTVRIRVTAYADDAVGYSAPGTRVMLRPARESSHGRRPLPVVAPRIAPRPLVVSPWVFASVLAALVAGLALGAALR